MAEQRKIPSYGDCRYGFGVLNARRNLLVHTRFPERQTWLLGRQLYSELGPPKCLPPSLTSPEEDALLSLALAVFHLWLRSILARAIHRLLFPWRRGERALCPWCIQSRKKVRFRGLRLRGPS